MTKWSIGQIKNDLSELKRLIVKHDLPIPSESRKKLTDKQANNEISIEDFQFNIIEGIPNSIPKNTKKVVVYFNNDLEFENINSRRVKYVKIRKYNFQVNIEAYDSREGIDSVYYNRFHLDKEDDSDDSRFTHPFYHFQFGSKSLKDTNTGNLLLLTSPRIPHPPMDFILGFHFIINNFFNSHKYKFVNNLLNDEGYQEIIERAQNRMWNPYFCAFSTFGETTNPNYKLTNVFPIYVQ